MRSSRADLLDEFVALDTNQYVLALRRDPRFPNCASLLFQQIDKLCVHVPLQVLKELHRNLSRRELRRVFGA
jgi:predicted nucleic acid-binding protein